ncbi:MAG: hypothetical protein GY833_16640 [Aestuariibacter sp.]|nr:hypothetical protein [Aestuariibacter sp.]
MGTLSLSSVAKGDTIAATEVNTTRTSIENSVNGIDASQINADAVGASEHADISASSDTFHSGDSIKMASGNSLETDFGTLEDKVVVSGTLGVNKPVGYDYDATSALASGASWTACSITVPANTATNGLKVTLSAEIHCGTSASGFLPLRIKVGAAAAVDLSTSGTRDPRFDIYKAYADNNDNINTVERTMWIDTTTYASFDKTAEIILYAGLAWNSATPATIKYVSMFVEAV